MRSRINSAARRSGRTGDDVRLLVAAKNRSIAEIEEAIDCGIRDVGENRVQEAMPVWEQIGDRVNWHFIGHLQRNKVKYLLDFVELIHSVDSLRLAREIDKRAKNLGKVQDVLLQVNVAEEQSKYGLAVSELDGLLRELSEAANISVRGVSAIAPLVDDPEEVRWVFSELRELGARLEREHVNFECGVLSMGMSNDFEVAVEEGSNLVRIGTAIFEGL